MDEFRELLIKVFEGDEIVQEILKSAERYAMEGSPKKLAGQIIKLFDRLL